jgi:flagellar hook-length control protein FliK
VGADGTSHVTIRLQPAELGHVEIRISRAQDGSSSVSVAVERPETLTTLQADLGHLHQALDRAGVPEQRSVSVHLAANAAGAAPASGGTTQGGFQQGPRQDRQHAAAAPPQPLPQTNAAPMAASPPPQARPHAGINITA